MVRCRAKWMGFWVGIGGLDEKGGNQKYLQFKIWDV